MKEETRLFFVVSSEESNCEIFDTLEEAEEFYNYLITEKEHDCWIKVAITRNAYIEDCGWNYEDFSDTFNFIYNIY